MKYGYVTDHRTEEGRLVVVGPFDSREAAATSGLPVVELPAGYDPAPVCDNCGSAHVRLPMSDDVALAYDAIFPDVLVWSEDDDCGMAVLMRDVAEAAVYAVRDYFHREGMEMAVEAIRARQAPAGDSSARPRDVCEYLFGEW